MSTQKTALLVIDMQKDVLKKLIDHCSSVVTTIQHAVKRAREKEVPVIFIARVHRKDGVDVEQFRLERFKEKPFLVEGSPGQSLSKDSSQSVQITSFRKGVSAVSFRQIYCCFC